MYQNQPPADIAAEKVKKELVIQDAKTKEARNESCSKL
jgi:hypothetical protein